MTFPGSQSSEAKIIGTDRQRMFKVRALTHPIFFEVCPKESDTPSGSDPSKQYSS